MYWNLMKGLDEVYAREDGGASELGRELLDVWHRISVHLGVRVEGTVVSTGPYFAVLLGNDVEG